MSRRLHRIAPAEPPSPSIAHPPHLPSDTWPPAHHDYSPGIHELACSINYLLLRQKCTNLRNGTPCVISPKYYVGANNLVREIVFQDGIVWIALFARLDSVGEFERQVALMRRLRAKVPVPQVIACSDAPKELGARYLIMEGVCGMKAEAEYFIFGIPDRHWNHVLDQLGVIMAEGMEQSWEKFTVNGKEYSSDSAFWIHPAVQNMAFARRNIDRHRENLRGKEYSRFLKNEVQSIHLQFAEDLYLCSDLLNEAQLPPDAQGNFPSHLPPLTMENMIFDDEFNIKGLIGLPRTESVSTWDYFQYPFRLDDTFDDPSMNRTVKWMREKFVEAWQGRLAGSGVRLDNIKKRDAWSQKDRVQLLYEFRTCTARSVELLQQIRSKLYNIDSSITLDVLFNAYVYTAIYNLSLEHMQWNNVWPGHMFRRLLSADVGHIHEIASAGHALGKGKLDGHVLRPPSFYNE